MSFSAEWLSLREPFDGRARNAAVLDAVANHLKGRNAITVVDLAAGTGSTLRAIAPRLPARQDWRLVDNNLSLLARAEASVGPQRNVKAVPVDLAHDLEAALDGPADLVTTSALLDLVSKAWLERLIVETAARNLPVYAALSYDGRVALDPLDPLDKEIVAAVNAHQRTDKGFGQALGPDAAAAAIAGFAALDWAVDQGQSDWEFAPGDTRIQEEILAGWAFAAQDSGLVSADAAGDWLARRRKHVSAGRSAIRAGHVDFFARPATNSR
jgi:hypothetical protein